MASRRRIPAGQRYVEYNFNDLNHNGKYDGAAGARRVRRHATRRRRRAGRSEHENAAHRRVQRHDGAPVLGGVVDPRHLRPQDAERLPAVLLHADRHGVGGQLTVPMTATSSRHDLQPARRARFARERDRHRVHELPGQRLHLRHDRGRVHQARRTKLFFQASGDYQWRNELRSADMTRLAASTSPLSHRSDRRRPADSINPNAPNRQKTTMYHAQLSGHYTVQYDIGVGPELPVPERLPLRADRSGRHGRPECLQLQLRVLRGRTWIRTARKR